MMHYRPTRESPCENGGPDDASRRHDLLEAVETFLSQVHRAKRAADMSLRRAQEAPEPHVTTNMIFVALYEMHLRDREALFEAMRGLENARNALHANGIAAMETGL